LYKKLNNHSSSGKRSIFKTKNKNTHFIIYIYLKNKYLRENVKKDAQLKDKRSPYHSILANCRRTKHELYAFYSGTISQLHERVVTLASSSNPALHDHLQVSNVKKWIIFDKKCENGAKFKM